MRTNDLKCYLAFSAAYALGASVAFVSQTTMAQETAQVKPAKESDYYAIRSYEVPPGVELAATSFQRMPDGKLAVASRRG